MFGPAGHLYVYFTYGMHWCANTACGEDGEGVGVLLRAIEPMAGIDLMRQARPKAKRDRDIGSGPARLTQAFGITGAFDGMDLVAADSVIRLIDDGSAPPTAPVTGPRIGISRAKDLPWRWYVPDHPHVSR